MNSKPDITNNDLLLVEYKAAQDSAQHHDNLIWTTTGVIWGASLILIGFVLQREVNSNIDLFIVLIICLFGIFTLLCLGVMALQSNSVKIQKYKRCRKIEEILNFEQHTILKAQPFLGLICYFLIMVGFIMVWVVIFITSFFV